MSGTNLPYNCSYNIAYSPSLGPMLSLTQKMHVSAVDVNFADSSDALNIDMKASVEQGGHFCLLALQ